MSDTGMNCPGCGATMDRIAEPDMSFEKCSGCEGVFLDAGELNTVVTGMPGDIEFCSIPSGDSPEDRFPTRSCPKCSQREMKKANLLRHTEIVFDHCEECAGWFLDHRELQQTNAIVSEIRSGDAEYRSKHKDRLVTLTKVMAFVPAAVGPLGGSGSTHVEWDVVQAFYRQPLGVGLRISPETWSNKFWKLLGVQDVVTGDDKFDREFYIKAEAPERAVKALSERAREAILHFHNSPSGKIGKKRSLEILDGRVVFCLTEWGREKDRPTDAEKQQLFDSLADVAIAIDNGD